MKSRVHSKPARQSVVEQPVLSFLWICFHSFVSLIYIYVECKAELTPSFTEISIYWNTRSKFTFFQKKKTNNTYLWFKCDYTFLESWNRGSSSFCRRLVIRWIHQQFLEFEKVIRGPQNLVTYVHSVRQRRIHKAKQIRKINSLEKRK